MRAETERMNDVNGARAHPGPLLISWNLTWRCNLRCAHCYLSAEARAGRRDDELTTAEAVALLDAIADASPGAMLVLSGGEPTLRPDLLGLARHATRRGLTVVVGTNGTRLDDALARALVVAGVRGVGISLDSLDPARHDAFRGVRGAWERAVRGIEACRRAGLPFQLQTTVTSWNYGEVAELVAFAESRGAYAASVFFLVCTGRGQDLTDITPAQYEDLLARLARDGGRHDGMRVRARCAPHLRRLAYQHDPASPLLVEDASRCLAGVAYCRITPDGQVTPCPYLPLVAGSVRAQPFAVIWQKAPILAALRAPTLAGRCGRCEFATLCGGCRARAFATTGDALGEDPWCAYEPGASPAPPPPVPLTWSEVAEERLRNVPVFVRPMVRRGVEAYARAKGLVVITPALMAELKARRALGGGHRSRDG